MGWTDIPTFTYDQVVDETDMNTYVKDNLDYFRSSPIISWAQTTGTTSTNNSNDHLVVALTSVAVPADVGACYVEVWSHVGYGASVGLGLNDVGVYVSDLVAPLIDCRQSLYNGGGSTGELRYDSRSFYARSADLAWAGLTKTVKVYINGYCSNGGCNGSIGPTVLRLMRSH